MPPPSEISTLIPVQPGERLAGRFVVERVVGTGGMGVVVAARHEQLGRTVAIKILTMSTDLHPEAVGRFLREARAAASLRSEHIARVMDAGTDERGRHFIVMEYLEGEDLAAVLRRGEPLSIPHAVGYLLQACEALAEAHTQGILHRDLKPENIFLTRRVDGSPLIKVLDFGVSKMTDPEHEAGVPSASGARSLLGSPLYMSPEQIRTPRSIDPRSDVWALGVILYELLTGRRPFIGESLNDILGSILADTPPQARALRSDLPPALSDIIATCLEKDVDNRMPSVGALALALNAWAPRWARDSSNRAARLAGMAAQGTVSIELGPVDVRSSGAGTGEIARPHNRALVAALIIGGAACGLLTLIVALARETPGPPEGPMPARPPAAAAAAAAAAATPAATATATATPTGDTAAKDGGPGPVAGVTGDPSAALVAKSPGNRVSPRPRTRAARTRLYDRDTAKQTTPMIKRSHGGIAKPAPPAPDPLEGRK